MGEGARGERGRGDGRGRARAMANDGRGVRKKVECVRVASRRGGADRTRMVGKMDR